MSIIKTKGEVFTPKKTVLETLKAVGYIKGEKILNKKIIDNSCGDGAFLSAALEIYAESYIELKGNSKGLAKEVSELFYGNDISKENVKLCENNLKAVLSRYTNETADFKIWDFNILNVDFLDNQFDFVVGNPPFVRTKNLEKEIRTFIKKEPLLKKGLADLYLLFFIKGEKMLNKTGKLAYIGPNSLNTNLASSKLRKHWIENKLLYKVLNLSSYSGFNVSVHTSVFVLDKTNKDEFISYEVLNKNDITTKKVNYNDFYINGKYYLNTKRDDMSKILNYDKTDYVDVRNGSATLLDDFFIKDDFGFDSYVIPAYKASTGKFYKALEPFNFYSPEKVCFIFNENPELSRYFSVNKRNLLNRSIVDKTRWFDYGRSQSLKDLDKKKIAVNTLFKRVDSKNSVKLKLIDKGVLVYGGLYILGKSLNITSLSQNIESILNSEDFWLFLQSLNKEKSGGYYTISSGELSKYLNYTLEKREI